MILGAVIERLREKATELHSVSPAEELEALAKGVAPKHGAAFVLPFEDRPEENPYATGGFSQRVVVQILVVFVLRQANDPTGGKRVGSFDRFQRSIEGALAGWSPGEDSDPFELAAGRSAAMGDGVTVYVQTWRTSRYLTAEEE